MVSCTHRVNILPEIIFTVADVNNYGRILLFKITTNNFPVPLTPFTMKFDARSVGDTLPQKRVIFAGKSCRNRGNQISRGEECETSRKSVESLPLAIPLAAGELKYKLQGRLGQTQSDNRCLARVCSHAPSGRISPAFFTLIAETENSLAYSRRVPRLFFYLPSLFFALSPRPPIFPRDAHVPAPRRTIRFP